MTKVVAEETLGKSGGSVLTISAVFSVAVDYDQTVEQMVEAGHYDWKNGDINSGNFQVNRRQSGTMEVHTIQPNRFISSDYAIKEMDNMGFRTAELPELLAIGAKHPDKQKENTVVALGSLLKDPNGRQYVPVLSSVGRGRGLGLYLFGSAWDPCCCFLAIHK